MSDWKEAVFHRLPGFARNWLAGRAGRRLQRRRYGPETDRLVAEAQERERFTAADWQAWHAEQLRVLLPRAATRVPHYRTANGESLADWPVLPKDVVRQSPLSLVADDCDPRRLFTDRTSGSSGTPVTTYWRQDGIRRWYALFEARCRGWIGATRHDPWAILGGRLVVPVQRTRPPFWVWNSGMRQLYVSSFHLREDMVGPIVREMDRRGVRYLYSYSSSLAELARQMLAAGVTWQGPPLLGAITNGEPLWPWQREVIAQAFGCSVRATWGMSEACAGASECDAGRLHLWPDAGVVELLDDAGDPVPPGTGAAGRVIATGLSNFTMPLIRYDLGDRLCLAGPGGPTADTACACGRRLPIIERIEGRVHDMLVTADGRKVFWLNPTFYGLPLIEAQIEQPRLGEVVVRIVPAQGENGMLEPTITSRLAERIGPGTRIVVERVERIPRQPNGKIQSVICRVPGATADTNP